MQSTNHPVHELYSSGLVRGNPGPLSYSFVLKRAGRVIMRRFARVPYVGSYREAEYLGMIAGLETCVDMRIKNVDVFVESPVIVQQMNGKKKAATSNMKTLSERASAAAAALGGTVVVNSIVRKNNEEARALAEIPFLEHASAHAEMTRIIETYGPVARAADFFTSFRIARSGGRTDEQLELTNKLPSPIVSIPGVSRAIVSKTGEKRKLDETDVYQW